MPWLGLGYVVPGLGYKNLSVLQKTLRFVLEGKVKKRKRLEKFWKKFKATLTDISSIDGLWKLNKLSIGQKESGRSIGDKRM